MENKTREKKALKILLDLGLKKLFYLGQGYEGVVFHDTSFVYKVILPIDLPEFKDINIEYLTRKISYFTTLKEDTNHLYKIKLLQHPETLVLKYRYEESSVCENLTEEEAISILTELWQEKIIIKDCKPKNCIRVNNTVKIIDLDGCDYNDNLFLNMCIRMYLYTHYYYKYDYTTFKKLTRSAINNFDLPELKNAREFINRVFSNIIFQESKKYLKNFQVRKTKKSESHKITTLPNLEQLFFSKLKENKFLTKIEIDDIQLNTFGYFAPQKFEVHYGQILPLEEKVSLLIKTCTQDLYTIKENIKHIVKQLSSPNSFHEVVVSIDLRESDFLREFNSKGKLEELIRVIQSLVDLKIVDRYILFKESKAREINMRWFNLDSSHSHTTSKIPVSPQLNAFEQCEGDYILQMDSDVLIGRKNYSHSFLSDMIRELKQTDSVVSVGFNIYNKKSKKYFGFEDGGFVPEVRMGLFDKKRLFELRPLPNQLDKEKRLTLSWHRSLEQKQKQEKFCSIRGGINKSFYIHPQNYRKKDNNIWMTILDRVEQNCIPDLQFGGFDCEGSYYDWCQPKRNEKMVIVSCFRNVSIERFLRMWGSLMSQTFQDFGVILLDDNSDNGIQYFIDSIISTHREKITFIKNRVKGKRIENEYKIIRNFISNHNSVVVCLDGDDAIIGNNTLSEIWKKYEIYEADVVVGRFHQTYRLQAHYRYPVDFTNPRKSGGNVWQHIKTFKKYLFDSIPLDYFKHIEPNEKITNNKWIEKCDDFAMMVSIIEMSQNPLQMDFINYFYERDFEKIDDDRELKEKCIASILSKPALSNKDIFKERKTFRPNLDKIEIDITYDCNLKCSGCNRSCTQAPTKEKMSLSDINAFINDSISCNKRWQLINILGGEPTLHPDFLNIIDALQTKYVDKHSPETIIQVVSNGFTEKSRELCRQIIKKYKNIRVDHSSFKTNNNIDYFTPFNDAPIDDRNYINADYSKSCWVTSYCGIGLNKRGYYACSVSGAIDRILKMNKAIPTLAEISEEKLIRHFEEFCKYCGNYKAYSQNAGDFTPRSEKEPYKEIVSKTWRKIYAKNKL